MPTATYQLLLDLNDDGDFSDAGEDISADVIAAEIERGFAGPLAREATVGRATFLLDNSSKNYSPPSASNVLPRREVRFDMTYSSTSATMFRGFIESIQPSPGIYRDRRVVLECVDALALLDVHEGPLALQVNVTASCIIGAVISAVYTPPGSTLQSGLNVFPFSADRWSETTNAGANFRSRGATEEIQASRKIEDACVSDWGRFFVSKAGCPTFHNRHQTTLDTTTELTLSNAHLNQQYRKAIADVFNQVEVTCHPRVLGTVNEVLGTISQTTSHEINSSGSVMFILHYRDPAIPDQPIGGASVVTPAAGTDYTVTQDGPGLGSDQSACVSVCMNGYADKAEIWLSSNSVSPLYLQTLQVRGLAVRVRDPVVMSASSASSVTTFQRRKLRLDAPLMSLESEAFRLAEYLADVYETPRDEVLGVEFSANDTDTLMAAARDLELQDRVLLTESQTGLSSYVGFVYRMVHVIPNKYNHHVLLDLETALSVASPFRLDVSALNSGHLLLY